MVLGDDDMLSEGVSSVVAAGPPTVVGGVPTTELFTRGESDCVSGVVPR